MRFKINCQKKTDFTPKRFSLWPQRIHIYCIHTAYTQFALWHFATTRCLLVVCVMSLMLPSNSKSKLICEALCVCVWMCVCACKFNKLMKLTRIKCAHFTTEESCSLLLDAAWMSNKMPGAHSQQPVAILVSPTLPHPPPSTWHDVGKC